MAEDFDFNALNEFFDTTRAEGTGRQHALGSQRHPAHEGL